MAQWWVIFSQEGMPFFTPGQSRGIALALCKEDLIISLIDAGVDEQAALAEARQMKPVEMQGPYGVERILEIHSGWAWALAAAQDGCPERPMDRVAATSALGEDRVLEMEDALRRQYVPPKQGQASPSKDSRFVSRLTELYQSGMPVLEVLEHLRNEFRSISEKSLYRILNASGVPLRGSQDKSISNLEELGSRYDQGRGESLKALAAETEVSATTLARKLEEADLKKAPRSWREDPLPIFLLCKLLSKRGELLAASVHREHCPKAPTGGPSYRKQGRSWHITRGLTGRLIEEVDRIEGSGVGVALHCNQCGGWFG